MILIKKKNNYSVYIILDENDNVVYVGMTMNFERRKKEHIRNIKASKTKLYKRLNECVFVSFEEVKTGMNKKDCQLFEAYLILNLYFNGSTLYQSLPKTILYHK